MVLYFWTRFEFTTKATIPILSPYAVSLIAFVFLFVILLFITTTMNNALKTANDELQKNRELNVNLEKKVEERSYELIKANEYLQQTLDDSSILVSDIGHKFYNELWPFSQLILLVKTTISKFHKIEKGNTDIENIEKVLSKCETGIDRIEEMKEKIKQNFGKSGEKKHVDVKMLIDDMVAQFSPVADEAHILLKKSFGFRENRTIYINAEQVKIAVENIINNSINAFSRLNNGNIQKEIKIGCSFNDNYFKIIIEDNGPGIPDELQSNIFKMFFTSTDANGKKGLGLGLHITHWIIRDCHKGNIEVESEEGVFTRFTISLPAKS